MRISDWSSDVCSSDRDLDLEGEGARAAGADGEVEPGGLLGEHELDRLAAGELQAVAVEVDDHGHRYARLVAQRERHSPLAGGEGDRAAIGRAPLRDDRLDQIGRASCRERVCTYV